VSLESAPAVARGSAENPLSDAEVSAKFHALMRSSGLSGRAGPIEELVMSMETASSIAPLLEELMRAPEPEANENSVISRPESTLVDPHRTLD